MAQRTHGTQGAQHFSSLAGVYIAAGFIGRSLRRADGLTLSVQDTKRRTLGPGDAARYVSITTGFNSEYAGNLYGPEGLADARSTENLDGCQFQHRASGVRYCITATADGYELSPVTKAGASR
jgi:hypothetical protein